MIKYRFIYLILILSLVSCHYLKRKSNLNQGQKPVRSTESKVDMKSNMIGSNLFLENRVNNCDSAFTYMNSVISVGYPINSNTWEGFRIKGESIDFLNQERKLGHSISTPNQRFYISLSCLNGMSIQSVLDIFIDEKYHMQIIEELERQDRNGENALIMANGFCHFTMRYSKGAIVDPSFIGSIITH